jgi:transcriptional regulator with XRE-family HTH domain
MRGFSANTLTEVREARNFSISDLARLAQIGRSTLHHWETGHASPQVDLLARVAQALDVPMSDLVDVAPDERFPGDYRVLRGLTQPQLGQAAAVPTATVGAVERGEVALNDELAERLAHAVGTSVAEYRAAHDRARRRPPGMPA